MFLDHILIIITIEVKIFLIASTKKNVANKFVS